MAITLRVVLVENLRRLSESIVRGRAMRQEADALADELLGVGDDGAVAPTARGLARFEGAPLVTAFAVQLVQRLREQDRAVTPALHWLDQRLAAQGTTSDDIVRVEHQRQAAMNVTVRNVIMSMSLMSALDWTEFFEAVSLVDGMLRAGPNHTAMDFATRDAYRHAVEELARGSGRSELEVAREAMTQTHRASGAGDDRRRDPGFYLIGNGRAAVELVLGYRAPPLRRLLRLYVGLATPGYLGTIAVLSAAIDCRCPCWRPGRPASATSVARSPGAPGPGPGLGPGDRPAESKRRRPGHAGQAAPTRAAQRRAAASSNAGCGADAADRQRRSRRADRAARGALSGQPGRRRPLRRPLRLDRCPAASVPGDDATLDAAREGIARLNRRHGPMADGGARFLLFHRRRLWNESEHAWMGWERKRGKLHELNRLLRGATDTSFVPTGSVAPSGVRYVITLDADTRLPRGAVERLVGTMAHPLNQPRFDPGQHRVVEGYGVLQPRVTPPLPGREGSWFQRLSSGPAGIDPYAAAVSDVYQDLWGEGSYTGKGIYDVDAFEAALGRPRARERAAEPRSLRGRVRARRPRDRRRAVRERALALRRRRGAPAPLGARRLAAAAVDPGTAGPGDRALEDARQPPPHGVGAGDVPDARRRVADARRVGGDVERLRARHHRRARAPAGAGRRDPRRRGISKRSHFRAVGRDLVLAGLAGRAHGHDAGVPGLADDRRDRADARCACTGRDAGSWNG